MHITMRDNTITIITQHKLIRLMWVPVWEWCNRKNRITQTVYAAGPIRVVII